MGGPRGPDKPVLVLHTDNEPAITPALRHVTEKVEALTYADGVVAPAWTAPIPVTLARMPLPRDLERDGHPELPDELKPYRGVHVEGPSGPRSKSVPDHPEHEIHEIRVFNRGCEGR